MIQCLEIVSLSDYCFFLWMSKASWGNQHGITQDNMPCSVYRWQLRLRAHNMRERAVSYTASDAAGRSMFFQIWKFLVDFPIKNGDLSICWSCPRWMASQASKWLGGFRSIPTPTSSPSGARRWMAVGPWWSTPSSSRPSPKPPSRKVAPRIPKTMRPGCAAMGEVDRLRCWDVPFFGAWKKYCHPVTQDIEMMNFLHRFCIFLHLFASCRVFLDEIGRRCWTSWVTVHWSAVRPPPKLTA